MCKSAHMATAPLNQASTNTPRSVLTLLTIPSTTASHYPVLSRLCFDPSARAY